ncbi:MAG: prenyltransferase [Brachymonas sp.]|jgi:1,4-dihydroxy-2-naphthoate octaprenyltransferase
MPSLGLIWRMTRPGFLTASAVACALGWAVAASGRWPFHGGYALWTLVLALALHAAANVLNDAADAQNGGDAINQEAIAPFTGGAGLIQSGQVSLAQTRAVAGWLFALVILGGVALTYWASRDLLGYGAAGALLAWGYSAPPLALMRRGVGELAVALAWVLMVGGADCVQRGAFSPLPLVLGLSYALLMANVLLVNGLPDIKADAAVGKRTLVVRLGRSRVPLLYGVLALAAHALALYLAWRCGLHVWALLPQLSALLSARAWWLLRRQRSQVASLRPVIVLTIAAALLHGLAWCAALLMGNS